MEINGNYGNIPTATDESKYTDTSEDAEQLRIDFLKMLTAQLEYQDPMEPVENTEFTAQMAQFSSLGEQQKGNELLQQLISSQNVNQLNQAVSYIGNQVVVEGNKTTAADGKATTRFNMNDGGVADINLYDQNGLLVQSATKSFGGGDQTFEFSDAALADGQYTFSVSIRDDAGGSVEAKTFESGTVTGAINGDSGIQLEVNGRTVTIADVRRVEQQTS
jgi:flagellar basal-body rod modification protein FlgD